MTHSSSPAPETEQPVTEIPVQDPVTDAASATFETSNGTTEEQNASAPKKRKRVPRQKHFWYGLAIVVALVLYAIVNQTRISSFLPFATLSSILSYALRLYFAFALFLASLIAINFPSVNILVRNSKFEIRNYGGFSLLRKSFYSKQRLLLQQKFTFISHFALRISHLNFILPFAVWSFLTSPQRR
jgi:hypothetical protein